jgi:hypothetical protein
MPNTISTDTQHFILVAVGNTASRDEIVVALNDAINAIIASGSPSIANSVVVYSDTSGVNTGTTDLIYSADTLHNADISTGTSTNATALTIRSANQTVASGTGNGAVLNLNGGSVTGAASTGHGGNVVIQAGNGIGGFGGSLELFGGNSTTGNAGSVIIGSGTQNNSAMGAATELIGGENTGSGNGGPLTIKGGFAIGAGNGGNVTISPGPALGGGTPGQITLTTGNITNDIAVQIGVAGGNDIYLGDTTQTNILWLSDGYGNIGAVGANRPGNVYIQETLNVGTVATLGATSTTPTHILNTATSTPAGATATLTNFPTGITGNPAGFISITINGSPHIIPYW